MIYLITFAIIWLWGSVVSYCKFMFIFTNCEPYRCLNQPVNHFQRWDAIWYDNFKSTWKEIIKRRRREYLVVISCSLAFSWFMRIALHHNHRMSQGYIKKGWRWSLPDMPDKENFRMAVLARRFGNLSWKEMVNLKKGEKNLYVEN